MDYDEDDDDSEVDDDDTVAPSRLPEASNNDDLAGSMEDGDEDGSGDDFDDFEEGAEGDDDFGDFDDGFVEQDEEPEPAAKQAVTSAIPSLVSSLTLANSTSPTVQCFLDRRARNVFLNLLKSFPHPELCTCSLLTQHHSPSSTSQTPIHYPT